MKKLISVVLVLAMLASTFVMMIPASAATTGATSETIYSENFTDKDGTYTLAELAAKLGWTLLRGDEAATAKIEGGVLTIASGGKDVVFEMDTDARYKANHTYQYDMTMVSYTGDKLCFSAIYTGTDDGATTKAIIDKQSYEGYNHLALVDGALNEGNISSKAYKIAGTGHGQARGENTPYGGGYAATTSKTTWKTVVDVTGNQVDAYASGMRLNSTKGEDKDPWAAYNVADYVGEGAYLRVQLGRVAAFDNISIVTGGEGVSYGDYVYYQDFSGITFDPATETSYDLASKIGFQNLTDKVYYKNSTSQAAYDVKYSIVNGALDIFVPATEQPTNAYSHTNLGRFATIYLPEMETAKDTVVIEYDLNYVNTKQTNEWNGGDNPIGFQLYGRRSDFTTMWSMTQKGWIHWTGKGSLSPALNQSVISNPSRPEGITYNSQTSSATFGNGTYHMGITDSVEHIKVVMSYTNGFEIYVNGILTTRLSGDVLTQWNANAKDIIGNILQLYTTGGCHVRLDNIKVSIDPVKETHSLLITEAGAGGVSNGAHEFVEVYNNGSEAVNIYDYCVINQNFDKFIGRYGKANVNTVTTTPDDIHLIYPGAHTYESIKKNEDGTSTYSITHTNPSYEEGWIQPGEVVVLWNTTNAMHNGGYGSPSAINWTETVATFKAGNKIPDGVKIFMMYNDYNRAFNNSGHYALAIMDRSIYQPGYDPATNTGSEALASVATDLTKAESFVYATERKANNNVQVRSAVNSASTLYAKYDYNNNNVIVDGVALEGVCIATGTGNLNVGVLDDVQKRTVNVTVNGKKQTVFLGDKIVPKNLVTLEGFEQLLWVMVDGQLVAADAEITVTKDITIATETFAMTTLEGVGVRINYDPEEEETIRPGMRWVTAINAADLEALKANAMVSTVEFGTLLARVDDLTDNEQELSVKYLYSEENEDNVVRYVAAYDGSWYKTGEELDYNGFNIYAGGVGNIARKNFSKDYCAVGYLTVTLVTGETVTIYAGYNPESHDRNAQDVVNAACTDYELDAAASKLTVEDYEYLLEYANY